MLTNFLKVAIRQFKRNTLSSIINITGLAVAIGTCMVAYSYLALEFNMESQHSKRNNVLMLKSQVNRDGTSAWFGIAPAPIGPQLAESFPQINNMTRIFDQGVVVSYGGKVFNERTRMVDPAFMEMFDFDIVTGNSSLADVNGVIISEAMARKYLGETSPLGKTITMRFGGESVDLEIVAVAAFKPMSTSFTFSFLTNYRLLEQVDKSVSTSDWSRNITATFIEIDNPSQIDAIAEKSNVFLEAVNGAQPDWHVEAFGFEVLADLYQRSSDIRWDISRQADPVGQITLVVIGLLMMTLACLNYLNIAISSATRRLKEIGLRKVIGATRHKLILQFVVENVTLSAIALTMGTMLGLWIFIPGFNSMFGIEMYVDVFTVEFYAFLVAMLLLTALASGAYPALYISKFQPVKIFRGSLKFGRKSWLTKSFLTLQYVLACVTIVSGIMGWQNANYQKSLDWGYDQQDKLLFQIGDARSHAILQQRLEQEPDVMSIATSAHHLGLRVASAAIELPERKIETRRLDVGPTYIETMGLRLVDGRAFSEGAEADKTAVVVNETFLESPGWQQALGKTFRYDSTEYEVVGVLKDFHYATFFEEIEPTFLRLAESNSHRFMTIAATPDKSTELFSRVQDIWPTLFPDSPFPGRFQQDLFNNYFHNLNGQATLMSVVGVLALMLSCFGLFGLVSLNMASRMREFSVRKVLGADLKALIKAVGSYFWMLLVLAIIIGGPVSYFLTTSLFDSLYIYHQPFTITPVLAAVGIILLTVIVTISSKVFQLMKSEPTAGLRAE